MEGLLNPWGSEHGSSEGRALEPVLRESVAIRSGRAKLQTVTSPAEALEALRSKPSLDLLTSTFEYLNSSSDTKTGFSIVEPGSDAAPIINSLVNDIIPDFWLLMQNSAHKEVRQSLLSLLTCVAGLGALIARLRSFSTSPMTGENAPKNAPKNNARALALIDVLDVVSQLLRSKDFFSSILHRSLSPRNSSQKQAMIWREAVSILGSSRLQGASAEAVSVLKDLSDKPEEEVWMGKSKEYCVWLGGSIGSLIAQHDVNSDDGWSSLALLTSRSLHLSHRGMPRLEYHFNRR